MNSGEEKAWEILAGREPDDVCRRACVTFNETSYLYVLRSFDRKFYVSPKDKTIVSHAADSEVLLNKLGYFFKISMLCYLNSAKDIPLTGRLVKPVDIKGGQLFFMGSHALPLERIAERYGNDRDGLLRKGEEFGGEKLTYGDASVRLFPFPRIPVVLILWAADEEFPARADLLFDSTCELHVPLDIIWAIAMTSLLLLR